MTDSRSRKTEHGEFFSKWKNRCPPSITDLKELAHRSINALPSPYRSIASQLSIIVEDLPSQDIIDEFGLENPYELSGIYTGESLTEQSVLSQPTGLNCVHLYRLAILDEWVQREHVTLGELISHVVVHELAHHIGLSDADIAKIDRWWE